MSRESRNAPFVVVGEALVDIVQPVDEEPTHAPGGSPMNVAVGLARLDVPTVLVTELGDDPYGVQVADHIRESGVELAEGSVRPGHRTSTATARLGHDRAATYDFDLTWGLERQQLPDGVSGLHVGSLGAVLAPGPGRRPRPARPGCGGRGVRQLRPQRAAGLHADVGRAWPRSRASPRW